MPPRRRKEEPQLSGVDALKFLISAVNNQAKTPNMHAYEPHKKQTAFHSSTKKGRLYIGGNRSGKSVGGVIEDLWWATGRHPHIETPEPPIFGRVVGVDFIDGIQGILLPIFKRWIVPSDLINGSWEDSWHKQERTLTLANGSIIDFKSNDQDLDKHAGTSRNFVHFDEEPPRAIFTENLLRLVDVGGRFWITMTPVEGMTWVYRDLYVPWTEKKRENLDVIKVDMSDNPYLSEEEKEELLGFLDDDDRAKREHGEFVPRGGLVFPEFHESTHATLHDWRPPNGWLVYHSVDHGFNNPTAHLWHAVSPDGLTVVTFHEEYDRELTVKEWAKRILKWEQEYGIDPFLRTGDPAMKQRSAETGSSITQLYAEYGIHLALDNVPRNVDAGVNKMTQYLRVNLLTGRPYWQISDCPNLVRELRQLQWDYYSSPKMSDQNNKREVIKKKDDHAPDSARYFFTFLPDLALMRPMDEDNDPLESVLNGGIKAGTIWEFLARAQGPEFNNGPSANQWMVTSGFAVTPDYWEDDY